MPLGPRNSGIVCQKKVDSNLGIRLENIFQIYIDDIIGDVEAFQQGFQASEQIPWRRNLKKLQVPSNASEFTIGN